jgi:hypothetical protein
VDRALQMVGESDPDARATLLAYRAEMRWELPAAEREALLSEADALAAQHETPEVLLDLALGRAALRDPTRLEESRAAIANFHRIAQRHAPAVSTTRALLQSFSVDLSEFLCALTACDLDAADGVLERCRQLGQETQIQTIERAVELMKAGRALGDARFEDVSAAVQRLQEAAGMGVGFGFASQYYAGRLVEAQFGLKALEPMIASVRSMDGFADLRPAQRMNTALVLARLNAKIGAHATSRRFLSSIDAEKLARMPVRYGDLYILCSLAETYQILGERDAATALYRQLLPYAELNAVGPAFDYEGAVAYALGLLAELLERRDAAARHFEHAETVNRKLRMPRHVALCEAARAALARGHA